MPCGKCANCLRNKQIAWCNRLQLHDSYFKYSHFITLTYDDLYCPYFNTKTGDIFRICELLKVDDDLLQYSVPCVLKKDLHDFVHKLRKYVDNHYNLERIKPLPADLKLSFFAVSEYGMQNYRPHYHLLLFHNIDNLHKNILSIVQKCWDM